MEPKYIILLFTLFTLSCTHKQSTSNKKDSVIIKQQPPIILVKEKQDTDTTSIDTTKELLSYNYNHLFSDTSQKDNFNIKLLGTSVTHGLIVFEISTFNHHQIFKEEFPSSDLLGDMEDVLNKDQQVDTIKSRMASFLNKDNFQAPAIAPNGKIEDDFDSPDNTTKIDWNDIKSDQTSIAFIYCHGYESTYGIAYSKKQKKVVNVFYSD
jgi:hypothetical protein